MLGGASNCAHCADRGDQCVELRPPSGHLLATHNCRQSGQTRRNQSSPRLKPQRDIMVSRIANDKTEDSFQADYGGAERTLDSTMSHASFIVESQDSPSSAHDVFNRGVQPCPGVDHAPPHAATESRTFPSLCNLI